MSRKTGTPNIHLPFEGLTPIQEERAKSFLSSILLGSVMAKRAGVQMDITKCIAAYRGHVGRKGNDLSLIHISEPTRLGMISYAVFCLKKKKKQKKKLIYANN